MTPIEGLTIRSQFGVDYSHDTGFSTSTPSYSLNAGLGSAGRSSLDNLTLTITNTVNYHFNLKNRHDFNFMLGQEGVNYHSENFNVTTSKQNNDALVNLSSGSFAGSWGILLQNMHSCLSLAVASITWMVNIMQIFLYVQMLLHVLVKIIVGPDSGL